MPHACVCICANALVAAGSVSFPAMLQQVILALPLLGWQAQMRGRMPASESQCRCLSKLAAWPVGNRVVSVHRGSAGKATE